MSRQYYIEVVAPEGLEAVRPHLSLSPFPIGLAEAKHLLVLEQTKASQIAGFGFESKTGDTYTFFLDVEYEPADEVALALSSMFGTAGLDHRVVLRFEEVDDEIEVVPFGKGTPNSAAHPEPLKRRTPSPPTSRRPGGRER